MRKLSQRATPSLRRAGGIFLVPLRVLAALLVVGLVPARGALAQPAPAPGPNPSPDCLRPPQGGASPPARLSREQAHRLDALLKPYAASARPLGAGLNASQGARLRQALCAAGFVAGPALEKSLARRGFSLKHLPGDALTPSDAIDPRVAAPAGSAASSSSSAQRRIPPRE